ncbi:hypothetical protein D3C74_35130 [compost metagenome]
MKYTDHMKNRIAGGEGALPWLFAHKMDTYEFCQTTKIPTPRMYAKFEHPSEIELKALPKVFVLKPAYSSTSRGVMVLSKTSEGLFDDRMSGETFSLEQIIELQRKIYDSHKKAKRKFTLVEEFVHEVGTESIPEDYKFLAFQGVIGLIIKINRNGDKLSMSYYDSEFRPLNDDLINFKDNIASLERSETPRNWERLLNVARRVSCIVPTPFARIDLFDSSRGPLLGEVTLTPGSFYYPNGHTLSDSENERLGKLWEDASNRLWGQ